MDRDDGVLAIHFAGEHGADLGRLHVAQERIERRPEISGDVFALASPLDENGDVTGLSIERARQVTLVLGAATTLEHFLRRRLVFPEIRRRYLALELGKLPVQTSFVKDPS
jgi:uncharacterized protein YuzE